jgi:predicted type IV restriction endonuclease
MDSATVDAAVSDLRTVVENFLEELAARNLPADRLGDIIEGDAGFDGTDLRQFPERFVEDHLIWPVLEVLGYAVTPRPDSRGQTQEEYPDFRVDNLPARIIGENKSVNDIETAKTELLEYLDTTRYEYGIATDGFQWGVYELAETDGRSLALEPVVEPQNLKQVVQYLAREERMVTYADLNGLPEPD